MIFFCYTFDGQSVVLEDYLEIFPHQKERLKKAGCTGQNRLWPPL